MTPRLSIVRKTVLTGALVAGVSAGAAGIASAATASNGTGSAGSSGASGPATPPAGTPGNPATLAHGPGETLLTGTDLQKAGAAAKAAVPGATIIRAETDSSGAGPYEVHLQKADGSYVTVELNSSFQAIKTISGFGAGPSGSQPPGGAPGPASGQTAPPAAA